MDTIIVPFGKYKGKLLNELLQDKNYTLWIIDNCTPNASVSLEFLNMVKFYYYKEMNNNKPLTGIPLTERIKNLIENRLFEDILSNIPNINIEFIETNDIISDDFLKYIQCMHSIYPQGTGCFVDYLFRHILSNMLNINFYDSRAHAHVFHEIRVGDYIDDKIIPLFSEAYKKVTNQSATIDIVIEIFIISLSHNIVFGQYNQQKSLLLFNFLTNNKFKFEFIMDIKNMINSFNGKKYALNPGLVSTGITADCDLIIDDNLIDFKVSKSNKDKYELLQLLGYSSLIQLRNHTINKIIIIDFYKNKLKTINISNWNIEQRIHFLKYIELTETINEYTKYGVSNFQYRHGINFIKDS